MFRTIKLLLLVLTANPFASATQERPNVIVIFVADMGFGDVGFNGATGPKTPNLDRMAREGMQFHDFYVGCAVCSGSSFCCSQFKRAGKRLMGCASLLGSPVEKAAIVA